jgi:hypothetical protein
MQIQTLGHATLVLSEREGAPILLTDPWLVGSCYWRSWWLENNPSEATIARLKRAAYCYLTHDHPDHFHTPSVRVLGKGPEYLSPAFMHDRIGDYLRARGHRCRQLPAGDWHALGSGVSICSIPCFGDDSALLIDSPEAVIVNLNDARPSLPQLYAIRRFVRERGAGKRRVALCSYSSAGIAHSCFRDGKRLALVDNVTYVRYASWLCRLIGADFFLPFASQVVFRRDDTRWADDFKVRYADLRRHWSAPRTQLLPPYTTLDLGSGRHESEPEQGYARDERYIAARTRVQHERERECVFDEADQRLLEDKLRAVGASALRLLCPRGLGFDLGDVQLRYDPWKRRLARGSASGSIALALPKQALKDVLHTGFFADLCIPMFTRVHLGRFVDPRLGVALFMVFLLHDIGATRDLRSLLRWSRHNAHVHVNAVHGLP